MTHMGQRKAYPRPWPIAPYTFPTMAPQQHTTALGIASKGGKITWTLLASDRDGRPRTLAQGGCARLDELRHPSHPADRPIEAATVIGVGCTSMSPALAELAAGKPVTHIDLLEGYLLAPLASDAAPALPYVALVASTRFTALVRVDAPGQYTVLGRTRDISAGAVFDKLAWQLGMDVPGGAALERLADFGDPTACTLPEFDPASAAFDFSFAELQAAALERARELEGGPCEQPRADLAASVQAALVRQLARQAARALRHTGLATLALSGGVTRNAALRQALEAQGCPMLPVFRPSRSLRVATATLLRAPAPAA